jgi:tetratricopeptide (TPR) repeat protein
LHPGADRTDAVLGARDRFDDAGLAIPRADLAADIAIHLNIGVVYLYQHDADKALDHLRLAAARASASRDASAQAHALELTGVAAWLQHNRPQALRWWREAERRYTDVDEPEGVGRCLQHLGSAALLGGAAEQACELLERSAKLRSGVTGHEVRERYLTQARAQLGQGTDRPGEPAPRPPRGGPLQQLLRLWRTRWR